MREAFKSEFPQIHPDAWVHDSAVVLGSVSIGADASVWPLAVLRGDEGRITIGARTSIQDGTVIHMTANEADHTMIGAQVTVGHRAVLHGCVVEDDCIIGMGSIILDGARIERGSIVGAGALVAPGKIVRAGTVVVGNPCRQLRTCTDADREAIDHGWRAYVDRLPDYRGRASKG